MSDLADDRPGFKSLADLIGDGAEDAVHPLGAVSLLEALRAVGDNACCPLDFYLCLAAASAAGITGSEGVDGDPRALDKAQELLGRLQEMGLAPDPLNTAVLLAKALLLTLKFIAEHCNQLGDEP